MTDVRSRATGIVLLALGAAALVWSTSGPAPRASSAAPRPARVLEPDAAAPLPILAGRTPKQGEPGRRAVSVVPAELPPERPGADLLGAWPSDLVRVHGRVRRAGRLVAGHDLTFHAMGQGLDLGEVDWDFTDETGRYQVWLPAGGYVVLSDDEGPWLANVRVPIGAQELVLDLDLPRGALRGRVVRGETGEAVKDARVHAVRTTRYATDPITQALMARAGEVRSRPDGSFEIEGLHPGRYLVEARAPEGSATSTAVVAEGAEVEDLELVLSSGHTLRGVLREPDGTPANLELVVCPGNRVTSLGQLVRRAHYSNLQGEFAIEGLQPGRYVICGVGDSRRHDLSLRAAIDFRPGAPPVELIAQPCGSLTVTVARPDGTPVRGAYLDLRAPDGTLVLASLEWLEDGPTSDANGRIALPDVMPGSYRIAAGVRGQLGPPVEVEVRSGEKTELQLEIARL